MKHLIKIIAFAAAFIMLLTAAMPVYADTIIDYVLYTDIRTYIGGVEISSYNINGYTAVVVEDLANYGFDVIWNGSARTLTAKRTVGKPITGSAVSSTSGGKVGERAMPVYATDIKTYFDGVEFKSYNVGGKTIVYVDDLANKYSSAYDWNQSAKTLKVTLSDKAPEPPVKLMDTDVLYSGEGLTKYLQSEGKSFSVGGKTIYDGFTLLNSSPYHIGKGLFNLEGKFSSFVFKVGMTSDYSPEKNYIRNDALVKIYIDGKIVSEYEISNDTPYVEINIPLNHANSMNIELTETKDNKDYVVHLEYGFFDCLLYP